MKALCQNDLREFCAKRGWHLDHTGVDDKCHWTIISQIQILNQSTWEEILALWLDALNGVFPLHGKAQLYSIWLTFWYQVPLQIVPPQTRWYFFVADHHSDMWNCLDIILNVTQTRTMEDIEGAAVCHSEDANFISENFDNETAVLTPGRISDNFLTSPVVCSSIRL